MARIRLVVSYDGTRFFGWQKTPSVTTIEGTLESVLEKILQHPVDLEAASRTDRGVHARSQIVALNTDKRIDPQKLLVSLNQLLPGDIAVTDVKEVDDNFHPTLDSTFKEYRYFISSHPFLPPCKRLYRWHVAQKLDIDAMKEAAKIFIGTHCFRAFTNRKPTETYSSTVRTLTSIHFEENEDGFEIVLRGDRFLYKMVRNIVGTLVTIGKGKLCQKELPSLLASGMRTAIGPTAPASGLFLWHVHY